MILFKIGKKVVLSDLYIEVLDLNGHFILIVVGFMITDEKWESDFLTECTKNNWQKKHMIKSFKWNVERGKIIGDLLLQRINLVGTTVLDVGCWVGLWLTEISKISLLSLGVDLNKKALKFGKRLKIGAEFLVGDTACLPVNSDSVDLVLCNYVIEHIPKQKWADLIKEIHRVLKSEATLYFSAPNLYWPIEQHYNLPFLHWLPRNLRNTYLRLTRRDDHCNWFTEIPCYKQIITMLENHFNVSNVTFDLFSTSYFKKRFSYLPSFIRTMSKSNLTSIFLPGWHFICRKIN